MREGGAGVENLEIVFEEGGFSTNEVSVVRNVASGSSRSWAPWERLKPKEELRAVCC